MEYQMPKGTLARLIEVDRLHDAGVCPDDCERCKEEGEKLNAEWRAKKDAKDAKVGQR